ncbi:hypothetical protein [Exiguobacterium sp.]|uniref:hypothetical protein n=1 Tax=Exiguobacterium sp. TaxID=44751 RepID=UPI0028AD620E|nr:hypothetical protein [Exiguobacterium sp.]
MDLLLRDIDPVIVKQIDKWAKEHNRSRQQYLKKLLDSWCANGIQSIQVERLERQLEANTLHLKRNADELAQVTRLLNEVMQDA